MTNSEYEKASITAALQPCHSPGEHLLDEVDRRIKTLEATLVDLLHARREIVNKYELNKAAK